MIQFTTEKEALAGKVLRFENVRTDQFFVCNSGSLCQKVDKASYIVIADEDGEPSANFKVRVLRDKIIQKILPRINKITF